MNSFTRLVNISKLSVKFDVISWNVRNTLPVRCITSDKYTAAGSSSSVMGPSSSCPFLVSAVSQVSRMVQLKPCAAPPNCRAASANLWSPDATCSSCGSCVSCFVLLKIKKKKKKQSNDKQKPSQACFPTPPCKSLADRDVCEKTGSPQQIPITQRRPSF